MNKKQKKLLTRILVSLPMVAALHFVPVHGLLQLALYLVFCGLLLILALCQGASMVWALEKNKFRVNSKEGRAGR